MQHLHVISGAIIGAGGPQAWAPRGSIEIAKCAIFRIKQNSQLSTSQTRAGNGKFARLLCRISGDGRSPGLSFCDLIVSALLTFQVLHILGGNACTVEE